MNRKCVIALLGLMLLAWGIFVFLYDSFRVEPQGVILLNTTDMHGDFEREYTPYAMIDFAQYVAQCKAENPNQIISIDCGDFSNGSPQVARTHGRLAAEVMMRANYDVIVLGNHEFDYGVDALVTHMQMMKKTRFLSANVTISGDSNIQAFHVFERMGKKIAVIGLMTPAFATESFWSVNDSRLHIETDLVHVLERIMRQIQPLQVDAIVLSMHAGIFSNHKLLRQLVTQFPEIEFYLGGHSHELILNHQLAQSSTFSQAGKRCSGLIKSTLQLKKSRNSAHYTLADVCADSRLDTAYVLSEMKMVLADFKDSKWDFLFDGKAPYFVMQNLIFEALKSSTPRDVSWISERAFYDFKRTRLTLGELYTLFPYNNRLVLIQLALGDLENIFLKIDRRKLTKNNPKDLRGLRFVRHGSIRKGHYDFFDFKGAICSKKKMITLVTTSYQLNSIRAFGSYIKAGMKNKTIKCQFLDRFLTDEMMNYLLKKRKEH